MLCAVCFNLCTRRNEVLQAWLCKQSDVGSEIVLYAKTCTYRPLPWSTNSGVVCSFQYAVQIVTCVERRVERDLRGNTETSVEAPRLSVIYIIGALHSHVLKSCDIQPTVFFHLLRHWSHFSGVRRKDFSLSFSKRRISSIVVLRSTITAFSS